MWLLISLAAGGVFAAVGAWVERRYIDDLSWDDYWRHI